MTWLINSYLAFCFLLIAFSMTALLQLGVYTHNQFLFGQKYGFSYLRCQLEPKIGTSCLLVSAGEKFGTSSTNLSSFQFQTFVKFMLA